MVVPYPPAQIQKTSPAKLFAHDMPWFTSKEFNGCVQIHWTMATRNPDVIDPGGKRQIASHFYPLIEPYSSSDPHVIEYHLLLMKFAVIDGELIDWYGSHDGFDSHQNRTNAERLIERCNETGLEFGIVYEDYTTERVVAQGAAPIALEAAQADVRDVAQECFIHPAYTRIVQTPLLLVFLVRASCEASRSGHVCWLVCRSARAVI